MAPDQRLRGNPIWACVAVVVVCLTWTLAGGDGESNDSGSTAAAAAMTPPPADPSPPQPPAAHPTGKVDVLVTWGSDTRIGADAGAVVYFLPAGSLPKVPGVVLADLDARDTLEIRREAAAKVGGYVGVVGGDGHLVFDRVKPGKYRGMIVSGNAFAPMTKETLDANRMILSAYVDNVTLTLTSHMKMLQPLSVEVVAGDTTHANHHFGPT